MTEYSSLSSSEGNNNARIVDNIRNEVALTSLQQLLQLMSEKCFHKCINYPSNVLDSKEQKCLSSCVDRFMETWNTVSQTYSSRLQKGPSPEY